MIWDGTKSYFSKVLAQQKSSRSVSTQSAIKFMQEWLAGQQTFEQKTSGSTGKPKPISLRREQMQASAERTAEALNLFKGTKALLCINPDFIGGKMMLVRAMELNWQLTLTEQSSDPSSLLDQSFGFDFAALVPIQVQTLLSTERGRNLLNSIKTIIIGGASISKSLETQLQTLKTIVYSTYGMTETVSHIALKRLNGSEKTSHFQLLSGIEVKQDSRGCLAIKADVTNHKWIQTNDVVELKNRSFQWLGRADFVINSGGIKIHLDQLEEEISEVLGRDVVLIKIPHELYGESYVLVLKEQEAFDHQTMLDRLKTILPKYHSPSAIRSLPVFPLTSSGKIDRVSIYKLIY